MHGTQKGGIKMKKICIAVFVASILLLAIGGAIIVLAMKEEDSKKARAGTIVAGTGMAGLTILGVIMGFFFLLSYVPD